MILLDIKDLRREYLHTGLIRENLLTNPLDQFQQWLDDAVKAKLTDPTAMTIATVSADGQPSQRHVLLKHTDQKGYVFYTNQESRKAQEIAGNNKVSLHFSWLALDRQVRIQGVATKLSITESLAYFTSRPRDSQLAAWASQQSRQLTSRQVLETAFSQMKQKFSNGQIPLPGFWGGYRVTPNQYEFWQGRANRLHDRLVFTSVKDDQWRIERLAP